MKLSGRRYILAFTDTLEEDAAKATALAKNLRDVVAEISDERCDAVVDKLRKMYPDLVDESSFN